VKGTFCKPKALKHTILRKTKGKTDMEKFLRKARWRGASNYSHQERPPDEKKLIPRLLLLLLERCRSTLSLSSVNAGSKGLLFPTAVFITRSAKLLYTCAIFFRIIGNPTKAIILILRFRQQVSKFGVYYLRARAFHASERRRSQLYFSS
jgi:hypothetical protein